MSDIVVKCVSVLWDVCFRKLDQTSFPFILLSAGWITYLSDDMDGSDVSASWENPEENVMR